MFKTETEWSAARLRNWATAGVALVALFAQGPIADLTGIEQYLVGSLAVGLLVGALIAELLFKTPTPPPSQAEVAHMAQQAVPGVLKSLAGTWIFVIATAAVVWSTLPDPWEQILIAAAVVGGCLAFFEGGRGLRIIRASRAAPELFPPRSQRNYDRAQKTAFNLILGLCFWGGVLTAFGSVTVPVQYALFGLALIGITTAVLFWCWYEWRDQQ